MQRKNINFVISWFVLSILLIPVFALNALATAPADFYSSWQVESDVLAVAKIDAINNGVDHWEYGLLVAQPNQMAPLNLDASGENWTGDSVKDYVPYESQLGLQGKFAIFLTQLGISSFSKLQAVNAVLFSFVFSYFLLIILRITNKLFASCVLATVIFSPWMVSASHSIFWAAWSWFLPAIFTYYFVTAKKVVAKISFALLVVLAFIFRFGSGYEFLTSFTLVAAGIPLLIYIFNNSELIKNVWKLILSALSVAGLAISAFLITLLIHSNLRGNGNVLQGIINIINQDVLRRTYGDPSEWANPEIQASLVASPVTVVKKYIFNWNTDFLVAGSGSPFTFVFGPHSPWALIMVSLSVIAVQYLFQRRYFYVNSALFLWASSIPFSWYVMAKSHSYIHTQINFVLWYLFFAAVLFYIPLSALSNYVKETNLYEALSNKEFRYK